MSLITDSINESINNYIDLKKDASLIKKISKTLVKYCNNKSSKILVCGNGGSATDADHFVTELMIRFKKERRSIPAISLSANPGLITACANDYDYKYIFKRQIEGLVNKKDCVVYISTSGKSKNIIEAAKYTKSKKIFSIGLSGFGGGELKKYCNLNFIVKSNSVARVQEMHIFLLHHFCEVIDNEIIK
jgi:D-sedoheptulose 7-phosphate isomerase